MEAWTGRAKSLLNQCQGSPACMAFLLDRLTDAVVAGEPEFQGADGGDQQQQQGAAAALGEAERGAPLPHALALWLSSTVQVGGGLSGGLKRSDPFDRPPSTCPPSTRPQDLLYEGGGFLIDVQGAESAAGADSAGADALVPKEAGAMDVDDPCLKPALWFNLDGASALVSLKVGGWQGWRGGAASMRAGSDAVSLSFRTDTTATRYKRNQT
jgi:hypothetical protein